MIYLDFSQLSKSIFRWPTFLMANKHRKVWKWFPEKWIPGNKHSLKSKCAEMKITRKPYLTIQRRRRQQQFEHYRRILSSSSSNCLPFSSSAILFFFLFFPACLVLVMKNRGRCWLLLSNFGLGFCSLCGLCFWSVLLWFFLPSMLAER